MPRNILDRLDDIEKYTGPRTCPSCGYQFPLGKFIRRFILSYGLSKWTCLGCKECVTCDFIKIQVIWLLGMLPFGALFGLLINYFDLGLTNILFLVPYFIFAYLTLYFAKFEKCK